MDQPPTSSQEPPTRNTKKIAAQVREDDLIKILRQTYLDSQSGLRMEHWRGNSVLSAEQDEFSYFSSGTDGDPLVEDSTLPIEEDFHHEFKAGYNATDVGERIKVEGRTHANAFLNSEGGVLSFGIRNDGKVVGFVADREQRDRIRILLSQKFMKFAPQVDPLLYRIVFHNVVTSRGKPSDRWALFIYVHRGPSGVYFLNSQSPMAYVRTTAGTQQMSRELILERLRFGKSLPLTLVPVRYPILNLQARHFPIFAAEWHSIVSHLTDSTRQSASAVISVIGENGIGKSTFAARVAAELASLYPVGTFYFDMSKATNSVDEVLRTLTSALLRTVSDFRSVSDAIVKSDLERFNNVFRTHQLKNFANEANAHRPKGAKKHFNKNKSASSTPNSTPTKADSPSSPLSPQSPASDVTSSSNKSLPSVPELELTDLGNALSALSLADPHFSAHRRIIVVLDNLSNSSAVVDSLLQKLLCGNAPNLIITTSTESLLLDAKYGALEVHLKAMESNASASRLLCSLLPKTFRHSIATTAEEFESKHSSRLEGIVDALQRRPAAIVKFAKVIAAMGASSLLENRELVLSIAKEITKKSIN